MALVERKPEAKRNVAPLIFSALAEAVCLSGGLTAYFLTGKMLWLIVGIAIGGALFVPGVLRYASESKERDRAAR